MTRQANLAKRANGCMRTRLRTCDNNARWIEDEVVTGAKKMGTNPVHLLENLSLSLTDMYWASISNRRIVQYIALSEQKKRQFSIRRMPFLFSLPFSPYSLLFSLKSPFFIIRRYAAQGLIQNTNKEQTMNPLFAEMLQIPIDISTVSYYNCRVRFRT